ncbi:hypothetical protein GBAR_LOCUS29104 [Geodia barretti]|uniref:Uncharacterized protein n=1 Tax=Geodia barretti TaxID=519541 RepID=A0AA35TT04_GEOBA|nr:hypothetical protein GBAR_LOCUS29104 [Geodia barretti]
MWILQRNITALRRKKKAIQKSNKDIEREAEDEFMKTLLLMEATLKAENEELLERKAQLQEAIKKEAELIDQYKVEMKKFPRRSVRFPSVNDEESGDEAELAKKIATLKWHSKEMEMRNKNLVQSIREEDVAILNLKVKLRVLPFSKELQVEQD